MGVQQTFVHNDELLYKGRLGGLWGLPQTVVFTHRLRSIQAYLLHRTWFIGINEDEADGSKHAVQFSSWVYATDYCGLGLTLRCRFEQVRKITQFENFIYHRVIAR